MLAPIQRTCGLAVLLTLVLCMAVPAFAAKEDSFFGQAEVDLTWMRASSRTLNQMLEDARRDRDAKMINCIESRLLEIQELQTKSEKIWADLREAAAAQDYPKVKELADKIRSNRRRVEQLMKLVNNCQTKITKPGGFTEVTEVSEGAEEGDDPTAGDEDLEGRPEPLPPEFEPPEDPSPS